MARKPRLEFESAVYHVLNRGNYRSDIFAAERTKSAFLQCLDEACAKTGWRVHAWCVMSNHYHVAITTPQPNLVAGMKWLQGTFANRFNRIRRAHGHLFQGRYRSLTVDPDAGLGPLCHYIHLNPVRARLCGAPGLARYRWTSLSWLHSGRGLPAWYDPMPALQHAGELPWTKAGTAKYLEYLAWLAEDDPAQKEQKFATMTKGWVIGSLRFAQSLLQDGSEPARRAVLQDSDWKAAQEQRWLEVLTSVLREAGRNEAELEAAPKSAVWKLELAAQVRSRTTTTNRWLSTHLHLGAPRELGRNLSAWARRKLASTTHHTA